MSAYWRVSEVRVIEDYAVWVRFKDGLEGVVRFLPGFFRGGFLTPERSGKISASYRGRWSRNMAWRA